MFYAKSHRDFNSALLNFEQLWRREEDCFSNNTYFSYEYYESFVTFLVSDRWLWARNLFEKGDDMDEEIKSYHEAHERSVGSSQTQRREDELKKELKYDLKDIKDLTGDDYTNWRDLQRIYMSVKGGKYEDPENFFFNVFSCRGIQQICIIEVYACYIKKMLDEIESKIEDLKSEEEKEKIRDNYLFLFHDDKIGITTEPKIEEMYDESMGIIIILDALREYLLKNDKKYSRYIEGETYDDFYFMTQIKIVLCTFKCAKEILNNVNFREYVNQGLKNIERDKLNEYQNKCVETIIGLLTKY